MGTECILAAFAVLFAVADINAIALRPNDIMSTDFNLAATQKEAFIYLYGEELYNSLPRITEEEFYNLSL